MHRVIFYSWQSDLPNATNRSFILGALENVAKAITADDTIDVEPVVDRDTQGVAGAPDIAKTIFQKLDAADVVIADVSIISAPAGARPTPNPNVLIELGYALRSLSDERVVLVFNTAYGTFDQLPFDLKMRRVLPYNMPASTTDRATERKALEAKLDGAIRAALASIKVEAAPSLLNDAIEAVEQVAPNRVIAVRRFQSEIITRLDESRPKSIASGATVKDLEDAVLHTEDIVLEYAKLTESVAIMGDEEIARAMYRGFGAILERYDVPEQFSGGTIYKADFDFMKFHGHELFVTFIASLIREERWELISKLLTEGIPVKYLRAKNGPANCSFGDISEHLVFGSDLNRERKRVSVHADILQARHTTGLLGQLMPLTDFAAADYFLFLRGELEPEVRPNAFFVWRPWSALWLNATPRYILDAENEATARRIARALGLPDSGVLRQRLAERSARLGQMWQHALWGQPLSPADIDRIGTRGN